MMTKPPMTFEEFDNEDRASVEMHVMRAMAWQRAKGELWSMGETFMGEEEKFAAFEKVLNQFVNDVEGEELDK